MLDYKTICLTLWVQLDGCTTCGPVTLSSVGWINSDNNAYRCKCVSGNHNFEGRIHPCKSKLSAAPLLCVAYAIVGDININLMTDPLLEVIKW